MRASPSARGFALAATLFALVLIGALVAGVFFAARQSMKLGENVQGSSRAFDAADAGLQTALARWDRATWDALAPGRSAAFAGRLPGGSGSFSGTVLRLNRQLFLIRSTGRDVGNVAAASLGSLVRLSPVPLAVDAALTTAAAPELGGASVVDGADHQVPGRDCPPPGRAKPGVLVQSGGGSLDSAWQALAAVAAKVYDAEDEAIVAPVPAGTPVCDTTVRDNWGDPAAESSESGCGAYHPVILAMGDLRIGGGSGQGILLVTGDLDVDGGFLFHGLVLVRGNLTVRGAGGRLVGAVRAANAALIPSGAGTAEVVFSDCATSDALLSGAPAIPLGGRSWVQLY